MVLAACSLPSGSVCVCVCFLLAVLVLVLLACLFCVVCSFVSTCPLPVVLPDGQVGRSTPRAVQVSFLLCPRSLGVLSMWNREHQASVTSRLRSELFQL